MKNKFLALVLTSLLTGCTLGFKITNNNLSSNVNSNSTQNNNVISTSPNTSSSYENSSTSTSSTTSSSSTSNSTSSSSTSTSSSTSSSSSIKHEDTLPEFDTSKQVTITFWHTMNKGYQSILDEIIADFNKTEFGKNITVLHEQIGGYDDVRDYIITNIPVNSTPNLAYCYPDHVALYKDARAVEKLDTYINDSRYGFSQEQIDSFVPGFYNEGKSFGDEKMYLLPFVRSTEVLYYNKTEFDKNGYQVPKTWDEMWTLCKKIKENNPNSIPLGYDSESNWFITNAEQNGYTYTTTDNSHGAAGHFLFNVKGNRDFVSDLKVKYDQGLFTTSSMYGAYTSGSLTASYNASLMSIGSTGGAQYNYSSRFETGIASVPQTKNGAKEAVISQGPSICMFDKGNSQEEIASWLFLKYLTTNIDAQTKFAKVSGYIPVSTTAQQEASYKAYLDAAEGTSKEGVIALASKVAVEQSDMYFATPSFVGSSQVRDEVGNIIVNVLSGTEVTKAFSDAIQECIEAVS